MNPFDQFDAQPAPQSASGPNPFDQFDGADMGRATSAVQGFNSTVPFGNRITAGMGALMAAPFTDQGISELYNQSRANQKTTEEAHKGANLAGSLGGLALTLAPALVTGGANTTPIIGKLADAAQGANSAIGNFVGGSKLASDAGRLARIGKTLGTAARSAVVAAPIGGLYGYGAGEEGNRIDAAAKNAELAAGVGFALPVAGAALSGVSDAVGGMTNRVGSLLGNEKAQSNIADNIIAKRLVEEGYSPEEITQLIAEGRASGLSPTLGEATGSSGVLQAEKSILRGSGEGANNMRDSLNLRNRDTVPNAINDFADRIQPEEGAVSNLYKAAAQEAAPKLNTFVDKTSQIHDAADEYANLNDLKNHLLDQIQQKTDLMGKQSGFWKRQTINETADIARNLDNVNKQIVRQKKLIGSIDTSQFNNRNPIISDTLDNITNSINTRLKALGAGSQDEVSNIESATLKKALPIINNIQNRGASFDALHDAQKQLSNIYIEGAQPGIQNTVNSHTQNYRNQISDVLKELAPAKFPAANKASMANMASQDLREAVNSTNEGSLATLYNKVWAKPELRNDFLRKLPDEETRQQAKNLFTQLENIKRGFGGSDTAFNLPANKQLAQEAGVGFDTNVANPLHSAQSFLDKIGGYARPGVYKKLAEQSLNPDTQRLIQAMEKVSGTPLISNGAPAGLIPSLFKGSEPQPAPQIPQTPQPTIAPQSQAQPQQQISTNGNDLFSRVIRQESGGNQSAISKKGAIGVAQIMPNTAKEAAEAAGLPYDPIKLRTNAQYNAALGKAYLEKLQGKYQGNNALALMAYNWGQGNVDMWIRSGAKLSRIPAETRNYLQKILS